MFAMLTQLAEILAKFGGLFVSFQRSAKDTDVATVLIRGVTALQDLCVRGERLLVLAGQLVDGAGDADEFTGLVRLQARKIEELQSSLESGRELLATVDAGVYLELMPFLDRKSGLMTRWGQQAALSTLSTTTLFFLPGGTLDRVIGVGLDDDPTEFVLAVSDGVRSARATEVRDLSAAVDPRHVPVVKAEIAAARDDLRKVGEICGQLLDATREAVGPEAMASLRRKLVS
ncbi:hypothetical protein ABZ345_08485 [Lentzea sp. NPDC005914]|uniref:hypothetical protein n=1 Tax=Lentzea sp. NPDC005914 TaxID=3154572 RepID=UPI0033C20249